jgi:tetratricopeptide (TPR) repeat protein
MSFWIRYALCICVAIAGVALTGCSPSSQSQLDEEKEPHFELGRSRVNAMDFQGAIEAFEESLEANPRSASAHFNLAWLYDEKESDPAAAIYHYEEYLKLRPDADNAEVIKQRIYRCKQQLAADVLPLPSTPDAQRELEQLAEQNRELQDEVDKWRAYYVSQMAAAKTNSPPQNDSAALQTPSPNPIPPAQNVSQQPSVVDANHSASAPAKTSTPRTHIVASGETAIRIAHRYGVPLDALLSANPGLNPKRMRIGLVLNIPSPQ